MRLFVTGRRGQVARAIAEAAEGSPGLEVRFGARPDVDLTIPETVRRAIRSYRPDLVINPAAYTAVDRAESEPELAFAVNRDGAAVTAEAAADVGAPVIHLSTDYVYDGAKQTPYTERDPVAPQGVYGASKLAGEIAVAEANERAVILRTAWVYAPYGSNFLLTMLRLAAERDRLRVVDDQVGCPTYAPDIASAVLEIAAEVGRRGWNSTFAGVTHLAAPDEVSWCGFARKIVAANTNRGGRNVPVDAITTLEFPTPAKRPANSRLSTAKLASLFGQELPPLDDAIDRCLESLARQRAGLSGGPA